MNLGGNTLSISKIRFDQSGSYSCTAKNKLGKAQSNIIDLQVTGKFIHLLTSQLTRILIYAAVPGCANANNVGVIRADLQETLELSCKMSGNPTSPMEFRWTLNTSADSVDMPRSQFSEVGEQSLLTFTPHTALDFGTISCLAKNAIGETRMNPCIFHIIPAGIVQYG